MGLCVSVACVLKPMLEVEGEKQKKRNSKKRNKIEYLNKMKKKIEFWVVGCVVKQYGIIDKIAFWDGKIGCDRILGCECSKYSKSKGPCLL